MNSEDLKAFVDGELPAWKRWLVARRVAKDPALQAEIEVLQKLSEDLASLDFPEVALSESLRSRLLATAPESKTEPILVPVTARRSPTKMLAFGLVGASALALIAVIFVPKPQTATEKTFSGGAAAPASVPAAPADSAMEADKEQQPVMAAPAPVLEKRVDTRSEAIPGAAFSVPPTTNVYASNGMEANQMAIKDGVSSELATSSVPGARLRYNGGAASKPDFTAQPKSAAKAMAATEQKEVLTLIPVGEEESVSELRKRVEEAVKSYGGKVRKQDPFEVTLPETLRSTARQKLLALVGAEPPKEQGRMGRGFAASRRTRPKSQLEVTIYFKD